MTSSLGWGLDVLEKEKVKQEKEAILAELKRLMASPDNKSTYAVNYPFCFDCYTPNPHWANVAMGTYVCLNCAAGLRSASIVLCQAWVRSTTLDSWSPAHLRFMQLGGNKRAFAVFKPNSAYKYTAVKYQSPEAAHYASELRRQVRQGATVPGVFSSYPDGGVVITTTPTGYSATFLLNTTAQPPPAFTAQ